MCCRLAVETPSAVYYQPSLVEAGFIGATGAAVLRALILAHFMSRMCVCGGRI